jgi:hypothetical protein
MVGAQEVWQAYPAGTSVLQNHPVYFTEMFVSDLI